MIEQLTSQWSPARKKWARIGATLLGLGAIGAALAASGRADLVGAVILWPAYLMVRLFPPACVDRGPGVEPFCEGTPVQLAAVIAGLILTVVWYVGLFLGLTLWWVRRQGAVRGRTGA